MALKWALIFLPIIWSSAASAASIKDEKATSKIEACLNSGVGVPTALTNAACGRAFNAAITEAQKSDIYSQQQRDLLWMQAAKAASLTMITRLKIDGVLNETVCVVALNGLKADNQISTSFKEKFSDLRSFESLNPIYTQCLSKGFYASQK